jgi:hypothetical protein
MARSLFVIRWMCVLISLTCATLPACNALADVGWDPIGNSTDFEDMNNWDAETYTPVPVAGNELSPPGHDSNFFIREGNHTVILENERSGLGGTAKLGTFTIGAGTYEVDDPGTTDVETTGPGDEIMTFVIRNSVTFTSLERNAVGDPAVTRPVRIGHEDQQPETSGNGQLDFPWGIVLHQAGTFTVEANNTHTNDQIRIGGNENVQGGGIYEISGTAKLNVGDKIRVGDRAAATSSANSVFRIRGSTMGTSKIDPAVTTADDFEIESTSGFWDTDRPIEYESRTRFNRGKGLLEFVLDENGVSPLVVADTIKIGDVGIHVTEGTSQYAPAFLRVKLARPLTATTPGMAGQDPLTLVWSDRITTSIPTVPNPELYPLYDEFANGRFFDPDRDGEAVFPNGAPDPAPHRFLPSGSQVIADYAGATYTWTIEYFEDGAGADNGVVDSYIRLVNGALSGTLGDLNSDTLLNESDRTELINAIAAPPVTRHQMLGRAQHLFDLNADDFIDEADLVIFNTHILAPTGVPGDYNDDGTVDAADHVIWRKGGPLQNEVDMPGTVNSQDYTAWRMRFGSGSPGSGGESGNVPEPSTFALTLFGLIAMFLFPRSHICLSIGETCMQQTFEPR